MMVSDSASTLRHLVFIWSTRLFSLILLAVAGAGCSRISQAEYFPVPSVGSVKEYAVESSAPNGKSRKGRWIRRIENETPLEGKPYLKEILEPIDFPGMAPATTYIRHAPDGIYMLEEDAQPRLEHLEIPFPVVLGKEWSYAQASGTTHCKIEGLEDIEIGGRVIKKCVRVSRLTIFKDDKEGISQTWYAPTFGEIKMTSKPVKDVMFQATLIMPAG